MTTGYVYASLDWPYLQPPKVVTLFRDALPGAVFEPGSPLLYRVVDDGDAVTIMSENHQQRLGNAVFESFRFYPAREPATVQGRSTLRLRLEKTENIPVLTAELLQDGSAVPIKLTVIDLDQTLFSRIQGIFEHDLLKDKLVTVVGLGTGGGLGAVELAKCGIARFRLADDDRLEAHNIVRHVCDLRDIGRLKTRAVREKILNINPKAKIELYENRVTDDYDTYGRMLDGSDLLFMAADSATAKFRGNELCLEKHIPAVYGGCFERAFGGEIIRVIPGETPCYDCMRGIPDRKSFGLLRGEVDYTTAGGDEPLKAQPGLSNDVSFIVMLQVKLALLTLLRGTDSTLADIPANYLYWYNRKQWVFEELDEPLGVVFPVIDFKCRDDCPTCQGSKPTAEDWQEAQRILQEARRNKKQLTVDHI
jgi:molybdopterin/thiamine biosynthesis adenylyltransferase